MNCKDIVSQFTPKLLKLEKSTKEKMAHVNNEGGLHGIAERFLIKITETAWEMSGDLKTVLLARVSARLLFEVRGIPGFSIKKLKPVIGYYFESVRDLITDEDINDIAEALVAIYSGSGGTGNIFYSIIKEVLREHPLLSEAVPDKRLNALKDILTDIYSSRDADIMIREIGFIIQAFKFGLSGETRRRLRRIRKVSSKDYVLISYPDSIIDDTGKRSPLQVLRRFLGRTRTNLVHILPFYPWDADRGFSVENYGQVSPEMGSWGDIDRINRDKSIMFDFVQNHASINNRLIQDALIQRHISEDDPLYRESYEFHKDYVIAYTYEQCRELEKKGAFTKVVRPRAYDLLTDYHVVKVEYSDNGEKKSLIKAFLGKYNPQKYRVVSNVSGKMDVIIEGQLQTGKCDIEIKIIPERSELLGGGKVWTTFSRAEKEGIEETRQVDLNYRNPNVFVEALIIALAYLERGASFLRLDAIGYLWKEIGSTCIHEKKTHKLIQAMQAVLKEAAPGIITVAEVNEPQQEAFKYVGSEREPEADMAYQFVHFPLAVYSVLTGDAGYYREWVETIVEYGVKQFLLVFGSHDGMGLKPIMNILPENELKRMEIILVGKYGARPNKARLSTGKEIIYEICATPWDLINDPKSKEGLEVQLKRYIVVAMMGMAHRALRAFYINSYIGSPNYKGDLDENRTVNRERFAEKKLMTELNDPNNSKSIIMQTLNTIIARCTYQAAFDPNGPAIRTMESGNDSILVEVLESFDRDPREKIIQMVNVSERKVYIDLFVREETSADKLFEIFSGKKNIYMVEQGSVGVELGGYDVLWLKEKPE